MKPLKILSGYEIMWLFVMFDLPVVKEEDRKNAALFRTDLLKRGFSMSQFSVYSKVVPGKDKAERITRDIVQIVPPAGKVSIVGITDKQYEKIVSTERGERDDTNKKHQQLWLF